MPRQTTAATREPFQWLFKAEFADGHVIEQDLDDTCHSRDDGTGSAFSDVLAYGRPVAFSLHHVDGIQMAGVDLKTGNFVVNNTPICIHNQNFEPQKYELELVYFRETRAEATMNPDQEIVGTRHFVNRYFIGWQTQVNGKNKQVTLAVG